MRLRSHLIGQLGLSLLALGVIPLPSREPAEVDLQAAERALDALSAAGISAPEVLEFAGGPERFAAMANICIANKVLLAEHGCPNVTDPEVLLGRVADQSLPGSLERLSSGRLALRQQHRTGSSDGFVAPGQMFHSSLHPTGYCRCGQRGTCEWCVMKAKRAADNAAAAERHEAVCELRRQNRGQQASARKVRQGKKSKRGF